MSKHQETKKEYIYRVWVPRLTNLGAAVVIVGAMFKILHLPNGGPILAAGLITEAVLFLIGVFAPTLPPEQHFDWSLVYPELEGGAATAKPAKKDNKKDEKALAALAGIDKMIADANISGETFKKFGSGMQQLTTNVSQMKDLTNVSAASNEYSKSLGVATKSMGELNKQFATTTSAMSAMANATKDAKEYHSQVQVITKNLGALNAVYEMELKDANSHLKAMNKFYSNLTVAMESMSQASKESDAFKNQMSKLTTNLTSLNKVYGNMLSAMKG